MLAANYNEGRQHMDDMPKKARPKGPTTLSDSDLLDINHRQYRINLADGVTVEDALEPEFWAHVGKKLRPFDSVRFQAVDRSFIADALVLSAGPGFANNAWAR